MPDTQREFDQANLEAKSEADDAMQSWLTEFLGHRVGGTLAAPSPMPAPQQPQGGAPQMVGPSAGGSDLGGNQSTAPSPEGMGYSAPGGY